MRKRQVKQEPLTQKLANAVKYLLNGESAEKDAKRTSRKVGKKSAAGHKTSHTSRSLRPVDHKSAPSVPSPAGVSPQLVSKKSKIGKSGSIPPKPISPEMQSAFDKLSRTINGK
jgi:hypothetical protein